MQDDVAKELERNRDVERFILFTDAVVAIAITLLVLPLVDEVTGSAAATTPVRDIISSNGPRFLSFLLSFGVIASLWLGHLRVYDRIVRLTPIIVSASLTWILAVVLLPFATALIANRESEALARRLYVGNVLLACGAILIASWQRARHQEVSDASERADRNILLRASINFTLATIAFCLVCFVPAIGMWAMLTLALFPLVYRVFRHRRPELVDQ